MFHFKNLALLGLFPGLVTTQGVANLGTYDTEVIITPVVSTGGGGYVPSFAGKPERYRVTVRVRINGVWHETSHIVDDNAARVTAKLNGVTKFTDDAVMVTYNGVQVIQDEVVINIQ